MKICIYQLALIALIFCLGKSLHCKHSYHSVTTENELPEVTHEIELGVNDFMVQAHRFENLHKEISALDRTDPSFSGKRRSKIKRTQNYSGNGQSQKNRQAKQTLHYLNKTLEQVNSATHLLEESNNLTEESLHNIPTE